VQRYVLNQQLNRAPMSGAFRKVFDLIHLRKLPARTGIGIFSGTLLVGTGIVLATAQSAPSTVASPVHAQTKVPQTELTPQLNTTPPTELPTSVSSSANSAQSTTSQTNSSSDHTEVTVNGETIPLPANGSVQKTVINNNGSTTVNVTRNSSQNGTNSYTNVQTNSFSSGIANSTSTQIGGGN